MAQSSPFAGLRCPHCGEEDTLNISLADLGDIRCGANDCEITATEVREQMLLWDRVLRWIKRSTDND